MGRAWPLVKMSAIIITPFACLMVTLPQRVWCLRNSAARRMCFVFLKATGSKAMATADFESHHIIDGPGSSKLRSERTSRIHSVSLRASMQPKNSDSALESVIERCVFENQWKGHPIKKKYAPLHENLVSQLESTRTCNGRETGARTEVRACACCPGRSARAWQH